MREWPLHLEVQYLARRRFEHHDDEQQPLKQHFCGEGGALAATGKRVIQFLSLWRFVG